MKELTNLDCYELFEKSYFREDYFLEDKDFKDLMDITLGMQITFTKEQKELIGLYLYQYSNKIYLYREYLAEQKAKEKK